MKVDITFRCKRWKNMWEQCMKSVHCLCQDLFPIPLCRLRNRATSLTTMTRQVLGHKG